MRDTTAHERIADFLTDLAPDTVGIRMRYGGTKNPTTIGVVVLAEHRELVQVEDDDVAVVVVEEADDLGAAAVDLVDDFDWPACGGTMKAAALRIGPNGRLQGGRTRQATAVKEAAGPPSLSKVATDNEHSAMMAAIKMFAEYADRTQRTMLKAVDSMGDALVKREEVIADALTSMSDAMHDMVDTRMQAADEVARAYMTAEEIAGKADADEDDARKTGLQTLQAILGKITGAPDVGQLLSDADQVADLLAKHPDLARKLAGDERVRKAFTDAVDAADDDDDDDDDEG